MTVDTNALRSGVPGVSVQCGGWSPPADGFACAVFAVHLCCFYCLHETRSHFDQGVPFNYIANAQIPIKFSVFWDTKSSHVTPFTCSFPCPCKTGKFSRTINGLFYNFQLILMNPRCFLSSLIRSVLHKIN